MFQEFIQRYQCTLEQAAASGRTILPKPPSPPHHCHTLTNPTLTSPNTTSNSHPLALFNSNISETSTASPSSLEAPDNSNSASSQIHHSLICQETGQPKTVPDPTASMEQAIPLPNGAAPFSDDLLTKDIVSPTITLAPASSNSPSHSADSSSQEKERKTGNTPLPLLANTPQPQQDYSPFYTTSNFQGITLIKKVTSIAIPTPPKVQIPSTDVLSTLIQEDKDVPSLSLQTSTPLPLLSNTETPTAALTLSNTHFGKHLPLPSSSLTGTTHDNLIVSAIDSSTTPIAKGTGLLSFHSQEPSVLGAQCVQAAHLAVPHTLGSSVGELILRKDKKAPLRNSVTSPTQDSLQLPQESAHVGSGSFVKVEEFLTSLAITKPSLVNTTTSTLDPSSSSSVPTTRQQQQLPQLIPPSGVQPLATLNLLSKLLGTHQQTFSKPTSPAASLPLNPSSLVNQQPIPATTEIKLVSSKPATTSGPYTKSLALGSARAKPPVHVHRLLPRRVVNVNNVVDVTQTVSGNRNVLYGGTVAVNTNASFLPSRSPLGFLQPPSPLPNSFGKYVSLPLPTAIPSASASSSLSVRLASVDTSNVRTSVAMDDVARSIDEVSPPKRAKLEK